MPCVFPVQSEPYMTMALAGARRDAGVSIAESISSSSGIVVSQIKWASVDTLRDRCRWRLIAHRLVWC